MGLFDNKSDTSRQLKALPVDKDLKRFSQLERAAHEVGHGHFNLAIGFLFLIAVWVFAYLRTGGDGSGILIAAAVIGGYMAMNIGANDVANNVGPAVGSKALTMIGALIIAAVFEAAGALIAGGDVVATISKGIVSPQSIEGHDVFIWAMMSALLSAAMWVNLATYLGAPVSTTHSIVGGVMGAGIAAAGMSAVDWHVMGAIAASWVISPVLGGIVAAAFLAVIKLTIIYRADKVSAARRWVPLMVAIMASSFTVYLSIKGLKRIWQPDTMVIAMMGSAVFVVSLVVVRGIVTRAARDMENTRKGVSRLFTVPLICSAALLSFAHGSNDVANAVGPLAAIVSAVGAGGGAVTKAVLPLWVLVIGALGISIGLALFGPKIIRLVGEKITKLDHIRAFCVALSASLTVIVASAFGLPVSSTHIAVGAVFGVGFVREAITNRGGGGRGAVLPVGEEAIDEGKLFRSWRKHRKRKLVRRQHLLSIAAAWIVTVPASAAVAALIYIVVEHVRALALQ